MLNNDTKSQINNKVSYSFLYLVQEGEGVDELRGGRGGEVQLELGILGLRDDGV